MSRKKSQVAPGLVFYMNDLRAVLDAMSDAEAGSVLRAIFQYFDTGKETTNFDNRTVEMGYRLLKPSMERDREAYKTTCENRSKAGKKYWEDVRNAKANAANAAIGGNTNTNSNTSTNANTSTNSNENANSIHTPGVNTVCVEKHTHRNLYGRYGNVSLSAEELDELKRSFPKHWNGLVEELSAAMYAKHLSYPDHLATLYNWAARHDFAVKDSPEQSGLTEAEQRVRLHPELRPQYAALDMMPDPDRPGSLMPKPEAVEREKARIAAAEARILEKEERT